MSYKIDIMIINNLNNNPALDFLPGLSGSFAKPAAENPTETIMECIAFKKIFL